MRGLVPTGRAALVLGGATLLALLSVATPVARTAAYGIDIALLLAALVDAILCGKRSPRVHRVLPRAWSVGRPQRVELSVEGARGRFLVHQDLFEGAEAEGLPLWLKPGDTASYRVTAPRRGKYTLGAHHLRFASPLGLWQRQVDVPAADEVRVIPDLAAVTEYELLARENREHLLTRTTRRPGLDAEFDRLRPWQRGDEYRKVDWKASARRTAPVVKQMRAATDQNVVFVIDCGRTMTAEHGGRPALDWALDAALMVGHVALRQGDRVGLLAVDGAVRAWVPPTGGQRGRDLLLREGAALFPTLDEPDWREAFAFLRQRLRQRALVVVFSNVVDDVTAEALARTFQADRRHLVAWVNAQDGAVQQFLDAPEGKATPWERGVAAEVATWRRRVIDRFEELGVLVIDTDPAKFTPALLARYLDLKARQLL